MLRHAMRAATRQTGHARNGAERQTVFHAWGGQRDGTVAPTSLNALPEPGGELGEDQLVRAFRLAEHHQRYNEWVGIITDLTMAFATHRWRLVVADGEPGRNQSMALDRWRLRNKVLVENLHREIWQDWITFNTAVVAKLPIPEARPMLLPPYSVRYSNRLGIEKLEFLHGLSWADLELVPKEIRSAFSGGRLALDKLPGAKFRVVTNARLGAGLGPPTMMSVFHACDTAASLAAADGSLAEAARRVIRQHKLGYEIRTGPMAGSNQNHAKPKRLKDVQTAFAGRAGVMEFADNFDHEVVLHTVDPRFFDAKRLDTMERRLFVWSAPLGQMLFTRGGIAPFLMTLLRVRIEQMRERVAALVNHVINEMLDAPVPLAVKYDSRILRDDRLAAEMLKFSLLNGLSSQRTARSETGLDDVEERRIKEEEGKQPMAVKVPVYDPNHGNQPGGLNPRGGRPRASGEPSPES